MTSLPAADLGTELAGELGEQALEQRLWERHRLHRGIGQLGEVHVHAAPRESGSRPGAGAGGFESLEHASVAQQLQDLPAETAGLRDLAGLRPPLEHQRSHAGQAQLTGQHQADRAGAHDDHVGVQLVGGAGEVHDVLPRTLGRATARRAVDVSRALRPITSTTRRVKRQTRLAAIPPPRRTLRVAGGKAALEPLVVERLTSHGLRAEPAGPPRWSTTGRPAPASALRRAPAPRHVGFKALPGLIARRAIAGPVRRSDRPDRRPEASSPIGSARARGKPLQLSRCCRTS